MLIESKAAMPENRRAAPDISAVPRAEAKPTAVEVPAVAVEQNETLSDFVTALTTDSIELEDSSNLDVIEELSEAAGEESENIPEAKIPLFDEELEPVPTVGDLDDVGAIPGLATDIVAETDFLRVENGKITQEGPVGESEILKRIGVLEVKLLMAEAEYRRGEISLVDFTQRSEAWTEEKDQLRGDLSKLQAKAA